MTFLQLQDRVMNRLNLTSTDARTRIKAELNDRYREVASGVNMARVRRTVLTIPTVSGNNNVTFTCAKLLDLYDGVNLKRPLDEVTVDQIRQLDSGLTATGIPRMYAVLAHTNDSMTLLLWPKPVSVYNLNGDALATGTDMSADGDEPALPKDFQDILVHGAMADELFKMEKQRLAGEKEEKKFEKRLSELRYFLAKTAYLKRSPQDSYLALGLTPRMWPYGVIGV